MAHESRPTDSALKITICIKGLRHYVPNVPVAPLVMDWKWSLMVAWTILCALPIGAFSFSTGTREQRFFNNFARPERRFQFAAYYCVNFCGYNICSTPGVTLPYLYTPGVILPYLYSYIIYQGNWVAMHNLHIIATIILMCGCGLGWMFGVAEKWFGPRELSFSSNNKRLTTFPRNSFRLFTTSNNTIPGN